jgi:hypothetical protein
MFRLGSVGYVTGFLTGLQLAAATAAQDPEWLQATAGDLRKFLETHGPPVQGHGTTAKGVGGAYWSDAEYVRKRAADLAQGGPHDDRPR